MKGLQLAFFTLICVLLKLELFSQKYVRLLHDVDYFYLGLSNQGSNFSSTSILLPSTVSIANKSSVNLAAQNHYFQPNSFLYHFLINQKISHKHSSHFQINQRRIEDYKETMISLGYGLRVKKTLSFGFKGNYFSIAKPEYQPLRFYSVGLDMVMILNKNWSLVADYSYALNRQGLYNEKLANKFMFNVNYSTRYILLYLTFLKYQGSRLSPQIGFQYNYKNLLTIKTGIHLEKPMALLVVGFNLNDNILFNLFAFWNVNLGINSAIDMTYFYDIQKKKYN